MSEEHLQYLKAAYLYYIRPELGVVLMHDLVWDALGAHLEANGEIEKAGSLFWMREHDYPRQIIEEFV